MDPQIPTSFIPKRPIVPGDSVYEHKNRAVGLLSLITTVIVLASGLSFVGVNLYQRSLVSKKVELEKSIEEVKNSIGTDFLSDMKRLTSRISGVKELVQGHVVVSPIFSALEATTLRSVQYKSFTYELKDDPSTRTQVVGVSMDGVAKNYSTIALQSDAFSQSSLIKNPVFSNLTVDDKSSSVNFKLDFDVAIADLSFQTFIDSKLKSQGQAPVFLDTITNTPETTQ
jgi:hypothetical protein